MLVQEQPRGCSQRRAVGESSGDLGPELADGAMIKEPSRPFGHVSAYGIAGAIPKLPEVPFKVHERHGRPLAPWCRASDRRPEVVDELADRVRGLSIRCSCRTGRRESAEQPQQQQRLMRYPHLADASLPESRQYCQQLIRMHQSRLPRR